MRGKNEKSPQMSEYFGECAEYRWADSPVNGHAEWGFITIVVRSLKQGSPPHRRKSEEDGGVSFACRHGALCSRSFQPSTNIYKNRGPGCIC
ncbi:hypothetical protein PAMA_014826 [Pampus argenteus]